MVIGDFNASSNKWCFHDKPCLEGITAATVKKQYGLHQVIKEPTDILDNPSSCIDLIFTTQPNLIIELSRHPSLHPNCHHQTAYAKFNV